MQNALSSAFFVYVVLKLKTLGDKFTLPCFSDYSTVHIGAIRQFLFWRIYYCHGSKSTGKKTGKMHLRAVEPFDYSFDFRLLKTIWVFWEFLYHYIVAGLKYSLKWAGLAGLNWSRDIWKCIFCSLIPCRCGDRLLAVDGQSLENIPHHVAVSMLKRTSTRVVTEVVSWMGTEL